VGNDWRKAYNMKNYNEKMAMDRSYYEEWGQSAGTQRGGRPKRTWKRSVLEEELKYRKTWKEVESLVGKCQVEVL
jgi:hypothetical protein